MKTKEQEFMDNCDKFLVVKKESGRDWEIMGTKQEISSLEIPLDSGVTITLPLEVEVGDVFDIKMEGQSVYRAGVIEEPVAYIEKEWPPGREHIVKMRQAMGEFRRNFAKEINEEFVKTPTSRDD